MKKLFLFLMISFTSFFLYPNHLHHYIWANYQHFGGNKQAAHAWYERIGETPHSVLAYKGRLHLLGDMGKHQRILELMPKVEQEFKNDPDVQLLFVNALQKTGKKEEADKKIIELSQQFKNHPEIVFHATETLVQRKELNNALALADEYLNSAARRPNNFVFYFLKAQIYMRMKDFKQARAQLQNCLEAHPRFPQGWLLKAMIEEEAGQLDQAIKGYSSYLELSGPNPQIQRHLIGLALRQKAAQSHNRIIVVSRSCFQKALQLFQKKEYRAALTQINECLSENSKDVQARLLKVQVLSALKEHNETIKTVIGWIAENPQDLVWIQTLHLLPRTGTPIEKVITAFSVLYTRFPQHQAVPLYLADLHTRAGNLEKAVAFHKFSLKKIKEESIRTRIQFQISALLYEDGKYEDMLATLQDLEKENSSFAPAFNLQAYYYATHGKDLSKAEQLFEKAYALDKGNPHYLDTKAVILYKQKKYDLALKLLKPLSEKLKDDSSIYIHLAKTYQKMGNLEQARTAIDHAKQHAQTEYEKKTTAVLSYRWRKSATT